MTHAADLQSREDEELISTRAQAAQPELQAVPAADIYEAMKPEYRAEAEKRIWEMEQKAKRQRPEDFEKALERMKAALAPKEARDPLEALLEKLKGEPLLPINSKL